MADVDDWRARCEVAGRSRSELPVVPPSVQHRGAATTKYLPEAARPRASRDAHRGAGSRCPPDLHRGVRKRASRSWGAFANSYTTPSARNRVYLCRLKTPRAFGVV